MLNLHPEVRASWDLLRERRDKGEYKYSRRIQIITNERIAVWQGDMAEKMDCI